MAGVRGVILLDRDGVLNAMCVDAEHGTIDSPLHPSQVTIAAGAPEAARRLCDAGYALAICTNQPAAAKGKTTRANLEAVHRVVVEALAAAGASVASEICFHRAEDGCPCRKPKPGLLEAALAPFTDVARADCWMVGDGITDVQAGVAASVKTALLGPKRCDTCAAVRELTAEPTYWGPSLTAFTDFLLGA
jgi:D-glycero-D-manno-heptose 1,7-bisphosphate phosphatase